METKEGSLREGFAALDHLQIVTLGNLMQECTSQKCMTCPILQNGKCELGKELPRYNPDQTCPFPILQAKSRIYGIEVIDENVIMARLQDIYKVMRKWTEDTRDCKYLMDCLLKIKEEYFPAVKKNLNVNLDIQVKDQFMKFYDEVVQNEIKNPNQAGKPINAKQVFDSDRHELSGSEKQN